MRLLAALAGSAILAIVLMDTFNTIVLPRRTNYALRVTIVFYRFTYRPFAAIAKHIRSGRFRESYLSVYGPFSLLSLIGVWATGIVIGFGLLEWATGLRWQGRQASVFDAVYLSATTFATLGTGEVNGVVVKLLAMSEGLLGLGFLGLNIGYLPTFYQSFSRREVEISLLDARAGSPPSALALIHCEGGSADKFEGRLAEWERWAAEILEHHLSYPILSLFRSHHENQSWLTALVAMVDTAAITLACAQGDLSRQAGLTFAMGRHALADIAVIFNSKADPSEDRLPHEQFLVLCSRLSGCGSVLHLDHLAEDELGRLRSLYESCALGLSRHLLMALPPWIGDKSQRNWISSGHRDPGPQFTVSDPFKEGGDADPH